MARCKGFEPLTFWFVAFNRSKTRLKFQSYEIPESVDMLTFSVLLLYHKQEQKASKNQRKKQKNVPFVCLKNGVKTVDI